MSDFLRPHGLYNPWNSPGQNTGVGRCSLFRGSSQSRDQPSSPALQVDSLPAEPLGKPGPQRIISALVRLVKAMVFPVVMYGCKSWTTKKAECQRIDAFELWCWKRLLRVPWTARRSNKSILKEISPGCSLEGLMLTVKL